MRVVFAEADKMFRLIAAALVPSANADRFLRDFFLTESHDPTAMMRGWSARKGIPPGIEVAFCPRPDALGEMLGDARVLVVESAPVRAEHLERAKVLKLIQGFGRQMPQIDAQTCASRGIVVRALDRHTNRQVAEHVVMLMLALTRDLDGSRAALQRESALAPSGWAYNWPACRGVRGLEGRVVGLVGLGQVGVVVADYLRPFGAKVLYTRRTRDRRLEQELGIHYAGLDELIARADVLSLHAPADPQTHHLINAERLSRAKLGLILVNTARGSLIDDRALVAALDSGKVAGAALDVFVDEPLGSDHPLRKARNVVLTPHVAAGTRDEAWLDREIGPIVDSILSVQ